MVTDIEIRHGGYVAVDTAELRGAAADLNRAQRELTEQATMLRDVAQRIRFSGLDGVVPSDRVDGLARRAEEAAGAASSLANRLESTAVLYELVELRAELAWARATCNSDVQAHAGSQLAAVTAEHPELASLSLQLATTWRVRETVAPLVTGLLDPSRLRWGPDPATGLWQALADPGLVMLSAAAIVGAGKARGTVSPRGRVPGQVSGMTARPVTDVVAAAAPRSLADLVTRIPSGDSPSRVRVDRFTMPGGSQRYAVYVAGTRSFGGTDPWNMSSNLQLYSGERSASLDVVQSALRAAGAQPGDVIVPVGHSQGGMIAAALAQDGGYQVEAIVTAGSPTEIDPGPDTMNIALRHTDDPVAALAGGGASSVGSADSIVVEREADPAAGWQDVTLEAHHLDAYADTARAADASDDPRIGAVREMLSDLGQATSVASTEYDSLPQPR